MSSDNSTIQRAASPVNSGRSSPSNPKPKQREEDGLLKKDKGYRRYASTVKSVLAQFDTGIEEWADYISFLGRLLKALSTKSSDFSEIPHKVLVAKRLAQCLNPVLPSGVHHKTLEVYVFIFSTIGKDGLAEDLNLYLPGLAPLLSFASLSVKPNILKLFETYIVALASGALRPSLKAIILALLPGLEEENSDEFDRTLRILEALKSAIREDNKASVKYSAASHDQYFWQCIFLACITSASRRNGALAYLVRNLPHLSSPFDVRGKRPSADQNGPGGPAAMDPRLRDAIEAVASPEPGLLIRCFCAGLHDEQLLIQRGFLDLLVTHLPLHSIVLQRMAVSEDLKRLVASATSVVARRDMSLNRRLWSWFLGPEPTADTPTSVLSPVSPKTIVTPEPTNWRASVQIQYFEYNGLAPLINSIHGMIKSESQDATERARPLRVCLSLMDKWDIGSLIVPQVFLPVLESAWRYQSLPVSKESRTEVLKSANMFFDSVESSLIWSELGKVLGQALVLRREEFHDSQKKLEFVLFVINNFNIREEEMQIIHMPIVSLFVLLRLQPWAKLSQQILDEDVNTIVVAALRILCKLLELIPARALKPERGSEARNATSDQTSSNETTELLTSIENFYTKERTSTDHSGPLGAYKLGQLLLEKSFLLLLDIVGPESKSSYATIELMISTLNIIVRKASRDKPSGVDLFLAILETDDSRDEVGGEVERRFAITSAKVSALEIILSTPHSVDWIAARKLRELVPKLVNELWPGLSPSAIKYNVEAVRCLWKLQAVSPDEQLVESTIVTLMTADRSFVTAEPSKIENARRFETLWTHSHTTSANTPGRRSSLARGLQESAKKSRRQTELILLERPLMLLLDSLGESKSASHIFTLNWLQSLPTLVPILKFLCSRLVELSSQVSSSVDEHDTFIQFTTNSTDAIDFDTFLHYFQTIFRVVQASTSNVWSALSSQYSEDDDESEATYQDFFCSVSVSILKLRDLGVNKSHSITFQLKQCALSLLEQFFLGPLSPALSQKEMDIPLLEELTWSVENAQPTLQISIMDVLLPVLRMRSSRKRPTKPISNDRELPRDGLKSLKGNPNLQVVTDEAEQKASSELSVLPPALLECLILGLRSGNSHAVLESWIVFLGHCLPLYQGTIFQILLPLVGCFYDALGSVLQDIQETFGNQDNERKDISEPTIGLLLNGLEQTLAIAHDNLEAEEAGATPIKVPEQQQTGFFGNMVSGVFTMEAVRSKTTTANKRLTVLLCFKDAIRVCFKLWSWGDSGKDNSLGDVAAAASFNYITLRLRNRTRRIFEHLFAAEPLECLETLVELWQQFAKEENTLGTAAVLNLLNALENSRPKNTIPAIFNAIYSRTNPGALEPSRKSTLTSDIADTSLAAFLVRYARSLEDDAMDEIWTDCVTFLRDVLANPMPHRQTLAKLLEFTSVLGGKVDNTNFGEQRKMRRELGDLFVRLLAATLTIRPMGTSTDMSSPNLEKTNVEAGPPRPSVEIRSTFGPESLVHILANIAPNLAKILVDSDRLSSTANTISAQVFTPIFRSKAFPENIDQNTLDLMVALSTISEASKHWKKDVAEAFNDPKFFSNTVPLVKMGWMPLLRSWVLADKDRMPELLSRLNSPSSAGFLGVGASSARLEADRKTQLNLRRIAILILASANDTFVVNLTGLQEKLVDLVNATTSSSPSSVTRAEIYMVIRALVLKTSVIHLSSFWPTVNAELFDALSSANPSTSNEAQIPTCLLQACKLLDTLLTLNLDDFQMQEWLFVSDTTDAVYRPNNLDSIALADNLAEALDSAAEETAVGSNNGFTYDAQSQKRRPLLTASVTRGLPREQLMEKVVRPFLRQLSIYAFESTYGMQSPDWDACFDDLVIDLFDDTTLV